MNNCTLAISISQQPELRYTANGDKIGQTIGEFYSPHHNDKENPSSPSPIKVVAWGERLADQLFNLEIGQQCIITGRLSTHSIERPEGFKEKKAELVVERIFAV